MWPDGRECLLPAVADFYWRRDMNSGVKWPSTRDGVCEIKFWDGWSDSKGVTASLKNEQPAAQAKQRAVHEVVRVLESQLERTFLGSHHLKWLQAERAKVVLRARVLEAHGTSFRVCTVWEHQLDVGRSR